MTGSTKSGRTIPAFRVSSARLHLLAEFRVDHRKGTRGIIEALRAAVNHPGKGTHPGKAPLFQKQLDGGLGIRKINEHWAVDGRERVRENSASDAVTLRNERPDMGGNAPVAAQTEADNASFGLRNQLGRRQTPSQDRPHRAA